jgi:dephospho-CoA kinase
MLGSLPLTNPFQPTRESRTAGRFRHGAVPVIGLIGGIGGGKSEVAALLKERGAVVIDADAVGHELLKDPAVCGRIAERFGVKVLSGAGRQAGLPPAIDRKALGAIVFADVRARHDLEAILHPPMRSSFLAVIERELSAEGERNRFVVLDAAVLLEAGWDDLCDLIVFVDAPREKRLRRVEEQRGWSREMLEARERAQWPADEKRRRADLVITNDAGVESLQREVERVEASLADMSCPVIETAN